MIHVDPALVAPVPATAPADAPAPARALIERQLAMLSRLAEIGMEIAEAAGREAVAEARSAGASDAAAPTRGPWREPGLAFARVARAVRMTIALQSRLMKDLADLNRADEQAERSRTTKRRIRLAQLVHEGARASSAERRAHGGPDGECDDEALEDEIDRLSSEAYERLIDAEDGYLDGRPFHEVVAVICKDLGLSSDWTARLRGAVASPPGRAGDAPKEHPREAPGVRLGPDPPTPPPDGPPCLSADTEEQGTRPAALSRTPP